MNSATVLVGCSVSTSVNHCICLSDHIITFRVNCFKKFIDFSVINVFNVSVFLVIICVPVFNFSWSLQKTESVFFEEFFLTETFLFH